MKRIIPIIIPMLLIALAVSVKGSRDSFMETKESMTGMGGKVIYTDFDDMKIQQFRR